MYFTLCIHLMLLNLPTHANIHPIRYILNQHVIVVSKPKREFRSAEHAV